MMMKPKAKPEADTPEPSLVDLVASAKTSFDHSRVKLRLTHMVAAEKEKLTALEGQREQAALSGTVPDLVRRMTEASETIKSLQVAIDRAEERRDKTETEEIEAAKREGARKAHERAPRAVEKWKKLYAALMTVTESIGELESELTAVDDLQSHALRVPEQHLHISRARIRADAAEQCPRPVLGAEFASPLSMKDSIAVAGVLIMHAVKKTVVDEDAFAAKRSGVIVDMSRQRGPKGEPLVDVASPDGGRAVGGLGTGVA